MGKIFIVVVTYANRWVYLESLLNFGSKLEDIEFVLVNNNSTYNLKHKLDALNDCKINFIDSSENKGSAWGYKTGLEFCISKTNCNFIWLLDDDNLPSESCLTELKKIFKSYTALYGNEKFALQCLRIKRSYLVRVANGEPVSWNFPSKNAFLGFHFARIFIGLQRRFFTPKNETDSIQIPCAPYGGLFFKKELIENVPLPDVRFFVYADDFDFTYNLTTLNKPIYLVKNAIVDDLAETWGASDKKPILPKMLRFDEPKIHMSVRNFVYFQVKHTVDSAFIFTLNKNLYIIYLFLLSVFSGRMSYFKRFMNNVKSGLKGDFY